MPASSSSIVRTGGKPAACRADWLLTVATVLQLGCASLGGPPPEPAPAYQGSCPLLGIEAATGPSDHDDDSISVVATYRFGGPSTADRDSPVALLFRIQRSRLHDLREHLETHPAVLCQPEHASESDVQLCVPPFEGQSGQPAR